MSRVGTSMPVVALVAALLVALLAPPASAQRRRPREAPPAPDAPAPLDPALEAFRRMVDADPFGQGEDDPIGTGAEDAALATVPLPSPEEVVEDRIPPREGPVLTAIAGVREQAHRASIVLRDGLAFGVDELEFASRARLPAEVLDRVAVPEGAALVGLEVCDAHGCREGLVDRGDRALSAYDDAARARSAGSAPRPIAHAQVASGGASPVVVVRAAPVVEGAAPLVVRVAWVCRTEVHGGEIRLAWPAAPPDDRAAARALTVHAVDLIEPAIDGIPAEHEEILRDGAGATITAAIPRSASRRASAVSFPCGEGRCAWVRALGPRVVPERADVVLALDVSPSTAAGARGAILPTARALAALLPPGSRVRVAAFASRAEEIGEGFREARALDPDAISLERELGAATRFEALFGLVSGWAPRGARLVVIGDGGWTEGPGATAALASARRAGWRMHVVNVAPRASTRALRAAFAGDPEAILEVGAAAAEAGAGRRDAALRAQLSPLVAALSARQVEVHDRARHDALGPLRTGEERVWLGPLGRGLRVEVDGARVRVVDAEPVLREALRALVEPRVLAAVDPEDLRRAGAGRCAARGPYETASAVASAAQGLALAHGRRCDAPTTSAAGETGDAAALPVGEGADAARTSLPAEVLLASLRRRVIPAARACFRDDRRGRADHEAHAELRFELADREVVAADVSGALTPALAACLREAIDRVEVPTFDGRIRARWPLHTAREAPPPVLELVPSVADEVDAVTRTP